MARPPMSRAATRKPTQTAARNTTGKITRRSTRFGHKLVIIHVGSRKTPFAIHEDLLCSNSNYFRDRLQKGRKAIDGQCSICTDGLSGFAPICYCTTCGQNMHTECLANWLPTEQTCPLCRAEWQAPHTYNDVESSRPTEYFPSACFNLYMHWLYTGSVTVDEEDGPDAYLPLLRSNTFGGLLEDEPFLKAVRKKIIRDKQSARAALEYKNIDDTYLFTKENSAARKFLVDLYLAQENPPNLDWKYHPEFIIDIAQALLSRRIEKDRDRRMLAAYLSEEDANVVET